MSLSSTVRPSRPSTLSSSLKAILKNLREGKTDPAGKLLRQIIDDHSISRSALIETKTETTNNNIPAWSIATLGARIALSAGEIEYASSFVRLLNAHVDKTTSSLSPTTAYIISGLIEIASFESLTHALRLLCSIPPQTILPELVGKFYAASHGHPRLGINLWTHVRGPRFPVPKGDVLVGILRKSAKDEDFSTIIGLVNTITRQHPPDVRSLPSEIPIEHAPQVITYAIRAGATQQSIHLWELALKQIGEPRMPATPSQAQFFGDPAMTYALVRHFTKLADKRPTRLSDWHRSQLAGNPNYFFQTAERIYGAFEIVHGFNQSELDAYIRADHYHITTSAACLFALDRFIPALEALNTFFRRNELPDEYDLGIILSALARRNASRAVQILLETAPKAQPGFIPTPYLYNIVLDHALKQGRMQDAVRVMQDARDTGNGSLNPQALDSILRSTLIQLEKSRKNSKGTEGSEPSRVERAHVWKRVMETLDVAQNHARPSTVRMAIQTAIHSRKPVIAWEIWIKAKKYGILGGTRKVEEGKEVKQEDVGPASAWSIARALWSFKQRGFIQEKELWEMVSAMGIRVPKGAMEKADDSQYFASEIEPQNEAVGDNELPKPMSFRRKSDGDEPLSHPTS